MRSEARRISAQRQALAAAPRASSQLQIVLDRVLQHAAVSKRMGIVRAHITHLNTDMVACPRSSAGRLWPKPWHEPGTLSAWRALCRGCMGVVGATTLLSHGWGTAAVQRTDAWRVCVCAGAAVCAVLASVMGR